MAMDLIWTYELNQAIETDKVDLKPFKPTGKFFEDIQTLVRLFGIKTHPALRYSSYRTSDSQSHSMSAAEAAEQEIKEITALNFFKYRLDKNTLRATFLCLPSAQII